jgi:hypothetical protein
MENYFENLDKAILLAEEVRKQFKLKTTKHFEFDYYVEIALKIMQVTETEKIRIQLEMIDHELTEGSIIEELKEINRNLYNKD